MQKNVNFGTFLQLDNITDLEKDLELQNISKY